MNVPFRNTKETLTLAGLEGNAGMRTLSLGRMGPETKPVYKIPDHLLTGVEGQEFHVNNRRDKEEMARVVKEASLEVLGRTGGAGFPLLFSDYSDLRRIRAVKRGVERAGATIADTAGICITKAMNRPLAAL